jgi:hypothetical protein
MLLGPSLISQHQSDETTRQRNEFFQAVEVSLGVCLQKEEKHKFDETSATKEMNSVGITKHGLARWTYSQLYNNRDEKSAEVYSLQDSHDLISQKQQFIFVAGQADGLEEVFRL